MPTIYLVRHGQKLPELGNPGLTALGQQQAFQTGQFLQQFPISEIISSPFQRTLETAEIIAKTLGMKFGTNAALKERMNWSDRHATLHDFLSEWVKATSNREYVPQHGDSSHMTGERVQRLINEVVSPTDHLLLISHGGSIVDYLRNIFGDTSVQHLKVSYNEGEDYQLHNCSVTKVILTQPPALELLNYTDHLTQTSE